MNNTLQLNVSTTAITVPIMDDGIEIGSFRFNPTDIDIIQRYDKVIDEVEKIELSEDAGIDEIFALSDKMKELIDYLLGFKCSEDIFSVCNPLSPCENGDLFIEVVLDGIVEIVNTKMEQRIKAKRARVKKATAKYNK